MGGTWAVPKPAPRVVRSLDGDCQHALLDALDAGRVDASSPASVQIEHRFVIFARSALTSVIVTIVLFEGRVGLMRRPARSVHIRRIQNYAVNFTVLVG